MIVMVRVRVVLRDPASMTLTVKMKVLATVGVPVIRPLEVSVRPSGRGAEP